MMYKLNIQIKISLLVGDFYSTGRIAGISSEKMKVNDFSKKS